MKKKKIIFISVFVILVIIFVVLSTSVLATFFNKSNCEKDYLDFASKNENTIFSINKIVLFSNCNAKNKNAAASNFTLENLYQYTDIAIFLNNNNDENNLENTLKSVKLENLQYVEKPSIGTQKLAYKNINSFAENILPEENLFEKELNFSISSNDTEDLSTPTLYNNCANPIVLSYINENIKTDYTITDTSSPISYDGSLLKKCGVLLTSLKCKISFDIIITNNLDQEFKCTVFLEPPLENGEKSLYDGALTITQNCNYNFIRYK